jgi:DNA-binding response OmpR family regulator
MTNASLISDVGNREALGRPSECASYEFNRPARVLVIDDDRSTQRIMGDYLSRHNMRLFSAFRRDDVARQFAAAEPDAVILDIQLGDDDGLNVLREIRSRSDVPVIIATGHRCDEVDRVVGLELGADDYLTKPLGLRELVARIRAALRSREIGRIAWQREADQGCSRFGGWQLDRRMRQLTAPNGMSVPLTKGDYALLIALVDAPQRPLTREYLLQATRVHADVFDRSIDVQILRLRRKLEINRGEPPIIQTVRGVGYILANPVERVAQHRSMTGLGGDRHRRLWPTSLQKIAEGGVSTSI